jgi:hypothetical protein
MPELRTKRAYQLNTFNQRKQMRLKGGDERDERDERDKRRQGGHVHVPIVDDEGSYFLFHGDKSGCETRD